MFELEALHEYIPCWDPVHEEVHRRFNMIVPHLTTYGDGFSEEPTRQADLPYPPTTHMSCSPVYGWDLRMFTSPSLWVPASVPLKRKLYVLERWGTALSADHENGVVHGNLTPQSFHGRDILANQGWPQSCGPPITKVDMNDDVYSARWAATELFCLDNGNPVPTQMSDVYSFGCLILQMLTGKVPYCGTKRPEQVVYLKHLGREPIDPQTPKVADRYVAFMRWCWSPEPQKRPTMKTVVAFIHEEIEGLGQQRG